jgi:PAS domain S-box-containing protein
MAPEGTEAGPRPAWDAAAERLYANAPIGICYFDRELRYRYVNDWLAKLNGVSVETHLGKSIKELSRSLSEAAVPQLLRVIESGEPILDVEIAAETPAQAGRIRHFARSYFPDKAADGEVVGVSCIIQDVTERRRAEDELRRSERRLKAAQRVAAVGNWERKLTEPEGWWSDETYRIFGVSPETQSLAHDALLERVHADDRAVVREAVQRAFELGEPFQLDYRIVLDNGEERTIHSRAEVVVDDDGKPVQLNGTSQDVTDRVRLEREITAAGDRERERIGRDLHDGLGQALVGASLMLKAMASRQTERNRSDAEDIATVQELLSESIEETRRLSLLLVPVFEQGWQLSEALQTLADHTNNVPGINCRAQCRFIGHIGSPDLAMHLYRIAQEGVTNSLKHSEAKNIYVNFEKTATDLRLEVLDDGIGIEVVEPVKGIGLRSMRDRARMIGARLDVTPREQEGTRVLCICPLAKPESQPDSSSTGEFGRRKLRFRSALDSILREDPQ